MTKPNLARIALVALGLLLSANVSAARERRKKVDPLEGIAVDVRANGETTYQPQRLLNPDVDIFLTAFMVSSGAGTRTLFLAVVLNGVGDDVPAPLTLSIDGSSVSLPLGEHPTIDNSGCTPSATQTIRDDGDLVRKIAGAKEVRVTYQSPDVKLESTLMEDDLERFRQINRLYGMADLPPTPKVVDEATENPALAFKLPKGVSSPELIPSTKVDPRYPREAFAQQKSGRAILTAHILKDGTIGALRPLSVYPLGCGFSEAAMEAVRQWRYRPALKKDKPVEVGFTIVVDFVFAETNPRVARAETAFADGGRAGL